MELPRDRAEKEEVSVASKVFSQLLLPVVVVAWLISPESKPLERRIGLILMCEFSLTKLELAFELKMGSKPAGKDLRVSRPAWLFPLLVLVAAAAPFSVCRLWIWPRLTTSI